MKFERVKHVYKSKDFEEIIKDTIRFFNGTPVHTLPPPAKFHGTGVYAIYYTGKSALYRHLYERNRTSYDLPLYIGKAVPEGWRQARSLQETNKISYELSRRLKEHSNSIDQVRGLQIKDFHCRFMILEEAESSLIGTVEAALIRFYKPLWNTAIDGFGNHDPGSGRYNQAKSDWDIIHKGRPWADKCLGESLTRPEITLKIKQYFDQPKDS